MNSEQLWQAIVESEGIKTTLYPDQVERSIKQGERIVLGEVGYMGAVPVFEVIPASVTADGGFVPEKIIKLNKGVPFTRVTARLTEVRADSRAERLAVLPPRRTKMKAATSKVTDNRIGGGTKSIGGGSSSIGGGSSEKWPDGGGKSSTETI